MIKLIAVDLDGTLLRTDKTISDYTKAILGVCREKGIRVIYATGRGGTAKKRVPVEIFDGHVAQNGAVAYIGDTLIYKRPVEMEIARNLLVSCDGYGLKTAAESHDMHYSNFDVTREWKSILNYQIVDFTSHAIDAEKLYVIVRNNADIAHIEKHLPEKLYMTVSRDNLAQIMHREATKSNAIAAIAEHWRIEPEEIAAFGDDLNDIDMLSRFGVGIAMEDALDDVKKAADEICGTNDSDGVARWIEKHLL